jgi:hypothetical protein
MKKGKGKINDYNKTTVKQKEYYYDREETDKNIQKDFGDMMADLKATSLKFKKELKRGKPAKLDLSSDALKEGSEWSLSANGAVNNRNIGKTKLKFEITQNNDDTWELEIMNNKGDVVNSRKFKDFGQLMKIVQKYKIDHSKTMTKEWSKKK